MSPAADADPELHHEWRGTGEGVPLLLIHGGGSTIETNWAALIAELASERRMLAVELQGHGHTAAGSGPASFERSADAVAALLARLGAPPVDVLGFSNGGQVALQLAARHPRRVARLVAASAPVRRDGMVSGFWEGMAEGTFADLPAVYLEADLASSGDPAHAEAMFRLDRELMLHGFVDFAPELLGAVRSSTLVVVGDRDVVTTDDALRLAAALPDARLMVVPGNHGDYLGEALASGGDHAALRRFLPTLRAFLDDAL